LQELLHNDFVANLRAFSILLRHPLAPSSCAIRLRL
jgi:hypothetical protein